MCYWCPVRMYEEKTDRKESKGRHSCLGDRLHSIPCCTRDLAPG